MHVRLLHDRLLNNLKLKFRRIVVIAEGVIALLQRQDQTLLVLIVAFK